MKTELEEFYELMCTEFEPLYKPIPEGLESKIEFFVPTKLLQWLMDQFISFLWMEFRPDCRKAREQVDQLVSDYLYQVTGIVSHSNDFRENDINFFSGFTTKNLDSRLVSKLGEGK